MNDITRPDQLFLNRELARLEFNARVLAQAADPATPPLERLKFVCITSSNLDEFFEIRVAGIKEEINAGTASRGRDELTPRQAYKLVAEQRLYGVAAAFSIVVFFILLAFTLINRNFSNSFVPVGVFVIDQWRQIGVTVEHRPLETAPWSSALINGQFDAAMDASSARAASYSLRAALASPLAA